MVAFLVRVAPLSGHEAIKLRTTRKPQTRASTPSLGLHDISYDEGQHAGPSLAFLPGRPLPTTA
jgi:hypothetical protein